MSRRIAPAFLVSCVVAAALAIPMVGQAGSHVTIGKGDKTCVLKNQADCRNVSHKWSAVFHGKAHNAKFQAARLKGADFRGASLKKSKFSGAKVKYADFTAANLRKTKFGSSGRSPGRTVSSSDTCPPFCPAANLDQANMTDADLTNADFAGASLTQTTFTGATAEYAIFSNASGYGANFSSATLTYADFTSGNFQSTNFNGANLMFAEMMLINLSGADLRNAVLTGTSFRDADLSNANLTGAEISAELPADFSGATFSNTICPDGTTTNDTC